MTTKLQANTTTRTNKLSLKSVLNILGTVCGLVLCLSMLLGFLSLTIVNGKSMNPTYHTGDIVISLKQFDYQIGDVIVYHPADLDCQRCNIVHRIIDGNATTGWITLGDNNENTDPWNPTNSEIKGKNIIHIPLGEASKIIFSPKLWLTLTAIIGILYLITFLKTKTEEEEEEEEETPRKGKHLKD